MSRGQPDAFSSRFTAVLCTKSRLESPSSLLLHRTRIQSTLLAHFLQCYLSSTAVLLATLFSCLCPTINSTQPFCRFISYHSRAGDVVDIPTLPHETAHRGSLDIAPVAQKPVPSSRSFDHISPLAVSFAHLRAAGGNRKKKEQRIIEKNKQKKCEKTSRVFRDEHEMKDKKKKKE